MNLRNKFPFLLLGALVMAVSLFGCAKKHRKSALDVDRPYAINMGQRTSMEEIESRRLMRLINSERVRRGLNVVEWSPELAGIARQHSEKMLAGQEVTLEGVDSLTSSGEFQSNYYHVNVNRGWNIFDSFENSRDDKVQYGNLIDPEVTHVGIALVQSKHKKWWLAGKKRMYVTQIFGQNAEAHAALQKKREWEAYIAEQLKKDKLLVEADLNINIYQNRRRLDAPAGVTISSPALEAQGVEHPTWSVLEGTPVAEPTGTPRPYEIFVEDDSTDTKPAATPAAEGSPSPGTEGISPETTPTPEASSGPGDMNIALTPGQAPGEEAAPGGAE